jgi:hypothetical protein
MIPAPESAQYRSGSAVIDYSSVQNHSRRSLGGNLERAQAMSLIVRPCRTAE